MGVPKRLTEMQKRFAEYLVFGGPDGPLSKSEAAELAGYSPKRSRVEGSELTNPRHAPLVVQYIGKLHDERLQKHEVSYAKHIAELDRIKQAALIRDLIVEGLSLARTQKEEFTSVIESNDGDVTKLFDTLREFIDK